MKPFSLTTVLDHRKRLLDLAKGRYAEAQAQYNKCKQQVEQCEAAQVELISQLASLQRNGIEIEEHIRYSNRIDVLQVQIGRLRQQLMKKQEHVLRERAHLLQKSKEHRVLEKLKERQNEDWRHFLDRQEARSLDEIALLAKKK